MEIFAPLKISNRHDKINRINQSAIKNETAPISEKMKTPNRILFPEMKRKMYIWKLAVYYLGNFSNAEKMTKRGKSRFRKDDEVLGKSVCEKNYAIIGQKDKTSNDYSICEKDENVERFIAKWKNFPFVRRRKRVRHCGAHRAKAAYDKSKHFP